MKYCLKLIVIFIFIIFANSFCYAEISDAKLLEKGNSFLEKYEKNENPEFNFIYLNKAQYYFYVASKKANPSTQALLGLSKVYIKKNNYADAKHTIFQAYSIDYLNPETNFYLADFHYHFGNYDLALNFFNKALDLGYKDKQNNYLMLAKCYEKLGDLNNAEKYYSLIGDTESVSKLQETEQTIKEENKDKEIEDKKTE